MNQEKIGCLIAKRRKELKITQKELAEKLDVSDKTISNWERGKYMPDYSLIIALCEILNISVNELLTGKNEEIETAKNVINFVKSNDKITKIGCFIVIGGLVFTIYSLTFMKQILNNGWGLFSIVGFVISLYGYILISRNYQKKKKILCTLIFIIIYFLIIIFFDLNAIINYNQKSLFFYNYSMDDGNELIQTPVYDLISCNKKSYKLIFHHKNNYKEIDRICKNS